MADGAAGNLLDGADFVLGLLCSREGDGQCLPLIATAAILLNTVAWVEATKLGSKTVVNSVDELVDEADRECLLRGDGPGSAHQALIIIKDSRRDERALAIAIRLDDVLDGGMRLLGITGADCVKN